MAACTSCAAASMLRSRSNCSVIEVEPSVLVDVIWVTPEICPNRRSSGCATVAAMTSGLAPGNCACTEMVGKSTCGSGATGSSGNATSPTIASAAISSEVAIGRRMKGSEMLMKPGPDSGGLARTVRRRFRLGRLGLGIDARSGLQPVLTADDHVLSGGQSAGYDDDVVV